MRADRLISILMMLQTKGQMTAQDLAEAMEVSERTIYRDLDALSAAGIPVYAERGPGGGCSLMDSYRSNLTGLTEDELRALFVLSVPGPLEDLGMQKSLEAAQLKLSATLSSPRRNTIEQVRQRIYLDAAGWFYAKEPMPYLEMVQEGVWQGRRIRITYRRSDGEWVDRLIDPYGLVAKAGIWYVVAFSLRAVLVYRISRIQEAAFTGSTFERPPNFDLAKYWTDHVSRFESTAQQYPIILRVAPGLMANLPQILGEGIETVIENAGPPDNAGWITLNLSFRSLEEARMYVLGFGILADVIEPAALRTEVREFAQQIAAFYNEDRANMPSSLSVS